MWYGPASPGWWVQMHPGCIFSTQAFASTSVWQRTALAVGTPYRVLVYVFMVAEVYRVL